jgi:hypothetical protein
LGAAAHIPRINMLEVRPDRVRIVGLAFEEYVIHAANHPPRNPPLED